MSFHFDNLTLTPKVYKIITCMLEFLEVFKQTEIGENVEIRHEMVYGYITHMDCLSDYFYVDDNDPKEKYLEIIEQQAIELGKYLYNFFKLTPGQVKMFWKDFEPESETEVEPEVKETEALDITDIKDCLSPIETNEYEMEQILTGYLAMKDKIKEN